MAKNQRAGIRETVNRVSNVLASDTNNFMVLFRSSGLPNDTFKGEEMEGWDLSNSDLSSLDLTGTVLVDCKIENTILPTSFDPKTQIRNTDKTSKTANIPKNFQP